MITPVAIIGAGPYGLSLAAHLAARGVEHRIFGDPLSSWERHMPDGMFLKSEGFASSIDAPGRRWTLKRFCSEAALPYSDLGLPVPIEVFRAYGRWFQQELVPHVEAVDVSTVNRAEDGFVLELASGEQTPARRVVVATGISGFAYLPEPLRGLPPGQVRHSYDTDPAGFGGRRVAVVGAGQSALETAALLHESGALPQLVVRRPSLLWNPPPEDGPADLAERHPPALTPLGASRELWWYWHTKSAFHLAPERRRVHFVRRTLGPSGAWWLRPRVADVVPVLLGQRLTGARAGGDGVTLEVAGERDTQRLQVDDVIAGTGYRIDIDRLGFLAPELRRAVRRLETSAGAPVLSHRFETSVSGLYFVGLAAADTFGPAMRFVCGSEFVSPRLARHLAVRRR